MYPLLGWAVGNLKEFTMNATQEHNSMPDGLDHLTNYEAVNAERRANAHGSEQRQRATVYASMLEVDATRLAAWVGSFLRRTPQVNRWSHQEELEQAIWQHLLVRKAHARGNWELVKLVVRDAYRDWYKRYADEAQLGVEAVNRAISLERAYARDHQDAPEGIGNDLKDHGWVGWETAVDANVDGHRAMSALPGELRAIVERKANGTPITRAERTRLQRFLAGGPSKRNPNIPTNKTVLAAVLAGTHIGKIAWAKPQR